MATSQITGARCIERGRSPHNVCSCHESRNGRIRTDPARNVKAKTSGPDVRRYTYAVRVPIPAARSPSSAYRDCHCRWYRCRDAAQASRSSPHRAFAPAPRGPASMTAETIPFAYTCTVAALYTCASLASHLRGGLAWPAMRERHCPDKEAFCSLRLAFSLWICARSPRSATRVLASSRRVVSIS